MRARHWQQHKHLFARMKVLHHCFVVMKREPSLSWPVWTTCGNQNIVENFIGTLPTTGARLVLNGQRPQEQCGNTHHSYYELKACRCDMFNSNVQQLLLFQARKNVLKYSHKFCLPLDDLTIRAHVLWPTYAG